MKILKYLAYNRIFVCKFDAIKVWLQRNQFSL